MKRASAETCTMNCPLCGGRICPGEPHQHIGNENASVQKSSQEHSHSQKLGCEEEPSHEHEHAHGYSHEHEHSFSKRDLLFLIVSAALFVTAFGLSFVYQPVAIALYLVSSGLCGYELFWHGLQGLIRLDFHEETLLTVAVIAAFCLGEWMEGSLVTILFCTGLWLESLATRRSKKSIEDLLNICPETANRQLPDGQIQTVAADEIQIDEQLVIRPFERVPLDCVIVSGGSDFNTCAITGESLPVFRQSGDSLLSGFVNGQHAVTCRATARAADSAAAKVVRMVEQAKQTKGKTEQFITRFARIYTPIVLVTAVLLCVLPPLLGWGGFTEWLNRALIFLVSSCPCALVISVPLCFFTGIGVCSKNGVLVKGSPAIEAFSKLDFIAFDKTGTLTENALTVDTLTNLSERPDAEIFTLFASVLAQSQHPSAQAVYRYCDQKTHNRVLMTHTQELPGLGVEATDGQHTYLSGSARCLTQHNISIDGLAFANVYLVEDQTVLAACLLKDQIREQAASTVKQLQAAGCELMMLTGDHEQNAKKVADACQLSHYQAGLLPEQKLCAFQQLAASHRASAFVGDGINDAPVLAAADVGISMGLGTAAAMESSDAILTNDDLSALPRVMRICKRTLRTAKGNMWFALIIKLSVLILGIFGMATMAMAVFSDVGVTLLSLLFASTILKAK